MILHVSSKSTVGGTLALVKDWRYIELDGPNRALNLEVSAEELRRRKQLKPPEPRAERGYIRIYLDHVEQTH